MNANELRLIAAIIMVLASVAAITVITLMLPREQRVANICSALISFWVSSHLWATIFRMAVPE